MKTRRKILIIVTLFLLGSQVVIAQYGTPSTESYRNVTKGAFWSKRPESKIIYNGGNPAGYTVVKLESDCYVKFIEEEHNNLDRNIIVFPKGEKIYMDSRGQYYAAICGNKIDYWQYVNQSQQNNDSNPTVVQDNSTKWTPPQNLGQAVMSMPAQNVAPQFIAVKEKTWLGKKLPWIAAVVAAAIVTTVIVVKNQSEPVVVIEDRNMPDGLGIRETIDGPGLDSEPRNQPGGLGGGK